MAAPPHIHAHRHHSAGSDTVAPLHVALELPPAAHRADPARDTGRPSSLSPSPQSPTGGGAPVRFVLTANVKPGFERAFEAWERHIANFLYSFYDGFMGEVRPPAWARGECVAGGGVRVVHFQNGGCWHWWCGTSSPPVSASLDADGTVFRKYKFMTRTSCRVVWAADPLCGTSRGSAVAFRRLRRRSVVPCPFCSLASPYHPWTRCCVSERSWWWLCVRRSPVALCACVHAPDRY